MANVRKNEYSPDFVFPPGETLLETIGAMGMTQAQLALRMGVTEKHINEVIKGKASLTEDTALKLERVLGINASFWRNLEHMYRRYLAETKERELLAENKSYLKKFPISTMIGLGWIEKQKDPVAQLSELLSFFRVASWESWENIWINHASFRQTSAFSANPNAVAAWLRRGEILADSIKCEPFDKNLFKKSLSELRKLSVLSPEEYLPQIRDICSQCGVAVVFLPELPETRVSGATRWLSKDKAIIQLSDRYKKDDHFWFTLFHEAGHVLLHGKKEVFIKENTSISQDEKEIKADKFAMNMLIPPQKYAQLLKNRPVSLEKIKSFAKEMQIAPGIVVGRLQRDKIIDYSVGNKLKKTIKLV